MSENKSSSSIVGTSSTTLLFITFLVLKLTKVIAWSWWWVTAPLWIPIALLLVVLVIFGFIRLVTKSK